MQKDGRRTYKRRKRGGGLGGGIGQVRHSTRRSRGASKDGGRRSGSDGGRIWTVVNGRRTTWEAMDEHVRSEEKKKMGEKSAGVR